MFQYWNMATNGLMKKLIYSGIGMDCNSARFFQYQYFGIWPCQYRKPVLKVVQGSPTLSIYRVLLGYTVLHTYTCSFFCTTFELRAATHWANSSTSNFLYFWQVFHR